MSPQRILITGGAGFIGSNAVLRFVKDGWDVTMFDNFSRKGTEWNLAFLQRECGDRLSVVRGDVRSADDILAACSTPFDAVLHLAAQVAVTTSVHDPRTDFDVNALGTFNTLEAVRVKSPKAVFLYASTNKVYGGLDHLEVKETPTRFAFADGRGGVGEDEPLDFHSPYGCSKGSADQYVRDYARIYGLSTIVFRQSCIYGTRQMGVEDQGWVAWFLLAGLFGKPVTIYGTGKQVRDLLHIDDLVDLYVRAIERRAEAAGHVFNIGGGAENTLSLIEFLDFLRSELGMDLAHASAAERPGDQPIFVSDNTKALRMLGWSPRMPVRDGLRRLHAWITENRDDLAQFYR
ncbi:MAG: dTDP-D-glucose 4,6-dehydratase [Candidatus Peregrinibacteria bacterium Gr01-1014_25]|nr:MAG: dTDP-D-glucose 4,6-dehydratase [Candidatus Peregrinibacteria bacterium Gr01-1014_25]